jgi:hypothetical protein
MAAGRASGQQTRSWAAPASGNWGVNANWSPPGFPNNSGPNTFDAIISVTGPAYTVTLDQDITIESLSLTSANATLALSGFNLAMNANYTQSNAVLSDATGTGSFRTSGAITLGDGMVDGVHTFQSQGTMLLNPTVLTEICDTGIDHSGSSCAWQGTGDIMMDEGATFRNGAGSTFTISNNQNLLWNNVGVRPTFNNEGVIRKTTGTAATFVNGVTLNNTGTVQVESGTFRSDQPAQVAAGTLTGGTWNVFSGSSLDLVGAAITTNSASITLRDPGSSFAAINGLQTNAAAGQLTVSGGRNFTTQSGFTNNGTLTVGSATTFQVAPGSALSNFNAGTHALSGGTYAVSGQLEFDNADIRTLGAALTLTGAGSDITDPVSSLSGLRALDTVGSGGAFSIQSGRNFQSAGNFTVAPSGQLTVGAGTLFRVAPGFTMTNFASGVFTGGGFGIAGTLQFDNAAIQTVSNSLSLNGPGTHIINQFGQDAFSLLNRVDTQGNLSVLNGQHLSIPSLSLSGRLGISVGGFDAPTTVTVAGNLAQDPSGVLDLDGGVLEVGGTLTLGGSVTGSGTINGNAVLNGVLSPGHSAGLLSIAGQLMLGSGSTVQIELGGLEAGSSYDQIAIAPGGALPGQLVFQNGLAGTLSVSLINGFVPAVGQTFDVALYSAASGQFASYAGLDLGNGLSLEPHYLSDRLELVVVPAPGTLVVLLPLVARRRRSRPSEPRTPRHNEPGAGITSIE